MTPAVQAWFERVLDCDDCVKRDYKGRVWTRGDSKLRLLRGSHVSFCRPHYAEAPPEAVRLLSCEHCGLPSLTENDGKHEEAAA